MLSTKSSSVTFFIFKGEHEFHGFNECFPILLIAVKKTRIPSGWFMRAIRL